MTDHLLACATVAILTWGFIRVLDRTRERDERYRIVLWLRGEAAAMHIAHGYAYERAHPEEGTCAMHGTDHAVKRDALYRAADHILAGEHLREEEP